MLTNPVKPSFGWVLLLWLRLACE